MPGRRPGRSSSSAALREYDVQIDVMYCGVCHSDLHQARNEWGNTRKYRFVIDLNSLRQ